MNHSRVLPFPTPVSIDSEHFTPLDGVDRDCVVRLTDRDDFGRAVYAAYDIHGYELARSAAATWEGTAKILTYLWGIVESARERQPKFVP